MVHEIHDITSCERKYFLKPAALSRLQEEVQAAEGSYERGHIRSPVPSPLRCLDPYVNAPTLLYAEYLQMTISACAYFIKDPAGR